MTATPEFLLFDLDGTLIDSVADLTCALNILGAELGHAPLATDYVRTIIGDGATKLIKRAFGPDNYQRDQLLRFLEIYSEHLLDNTCCYPGISELLHRHPTEKMALVTNKPHRLTVDLLQGLGIAQHFKAIIGGDSYPEKKPHPQPVHEALQLLGAPAEKAVMIGDHHTDLYSGKAAGVATCFCAYGLGHTDGLSPDYLAESSTDLLRLFPVAKQ
ncbi:MAG TPA: HAD-IA family hydrolase [Malonomonas sp.]